MYLHRIHLNPRSKQARRDLSDPYQMHATLCRAFFPEETRCSPGALLWRLEPETDREGRPLVLIQSHETADWSRLPSDWLAYTDPGLDLVQRLSLDALEAGQAYRFRLRANPCKTVQGKRLGLFQPDAQRAWLARQGERHGFALPESSAPDYFEFLASANGSSYADFRISQEQMLRGRQHEGNEIRVYSALFEGRLTVTDIKQFRKVLETGIGHGKVMGLGLLSVVPSRG
jgi:CRISPR system Cascade subunit CasE